MTSSNNSQGEHYNLRWNNYFTNIVQVFTDLRQKEQMVDVTLVCENQQIKVHRIILSACSGFFMDLFQNMTEKHPMLIFHEIKFLHLMHIINFLYQGEVKVLDVDLEGVLILGERFQVKGLSSVKLKNKVTSASESDTDLSKNEEFKHAIKYEIKSSDRASPILHQNKNVEKKFDKSRVINSNESQTKWGIKNKLIIDSNSQSVKKFKHISTLTKVNRTMINERKDDLYKLNTETKHHNLKIYGVPKKQQLNINEEKVQSIKTEETVDQNNSIDEATNLNKTTNLREESLKNNSNKHIESRSTSPDVALIHINKLNEIKKPVNAFILFSKEWRKKLEVEHPNENFKSISVRLGNLWKSLTSETRESYYVAARQEQLSDQ